MTEVKTKNILFEIANKNVLNSCKFQWLAFYHKKLI